MKRNGLFITLEGPEGSGKTTIAKKLGEYFQKETDFKVINTREPGGISISEKIRSIILDEKNTEMDGKTEALLYAASRRQHMVEKVIPALNDGCIVICDRFIDSSLVYQGYARNIGINEVYEINRFAIDEYIPDLTIFFDITPELGIERISKNEREVNRLDLESIEFHRDVYEGYKLISELDSGERIKKVSAHEEVDVVFRNTKKVILDVVEKRLPFLQKTVKN